MSLKKVYNVAGLDGINESPGMYSVGDAITGEGIFRTIKLVPKGTYDSHDELMDAIVYYNRSDLRSRPSDYANETQDTYGLLELMETGCVAICSKVTKEFFFEVKKALYRDKAEEKARYFFPDGTCFFEIRTRSITPTFLPSLTPKVARWGKTAFLRWIGYY